MEKPKDSFQDRHARGNTSLPAELWAFLKQSKKYWLLPLILLLLLAGVLLVVSGSSLAPFIYPLF